MPEVAKKISNLVLIWFDNKQVVIYKALGQEITFLTKNLHSFGKADIIEIRNDGNLRVCRVPYISFIDHEDHHSGVCYWLYNPKSMIINFCDQLIQSNFIEICITKIKNLLLVQPQKWWHQQWQRQHCMPPDPVHKNSLCMEDDGGYGLTGWVTYDISIPQQR